MSKITLTPNASGTGTFTIASPNSNTNRTLTLPDEAGELLINGTTSNVGIGTSSPSTTIEAVGNLDILQLTGTSSNAFARFTDNDATSDFSIGADDNSGAGAGAFIIYDRNNNAYRMLIDSNGRVAIGGTTVTDVNMLNIQGSGASSNIGVVFNDTNTSKVYGIQNGGSTLRFHDYSASATRMSIDSSGNLLVGKTSTSSTTAGGNIFGGLGSFVRDGNTPLSLNRRTNNGEIVSFAAQDSVVGSIFSSGSQYVGMGSTDVGLLFLGAADDIRPWNPSSNTARDNAIDLGNSDARFDDIYATNGTIQTSDRNEKQDIEALSDAEQRVAVACKGLLRKFRWIDSVAEKGDAARIHFGIIAQDLQDAFAAEGLDAGRYAMFISTTWWETQTEVPAVEAVEAAYEDVVIPAVLDEDGNEVEAERTEQQLVTEAVEAKEAYTRTDTYETLEEAPEGATERTRLGVRYPELLAFIIGAM